MLASLTFADSDVQNLIGKRELRVFKNGSGKLLHCFLGFRAKPGLIDSIFIFTKLFSINEDNIVVRESKIFEEANNDVSDCFPRLVGFINSEDQPLMPDHVILSFEG